MKIKRFEADSMSEALRLIKKEFGEEAVILSAKNNKKSGRLFGGKNERVVVTAAIDYATVDGAASDAPSDQGNEAVPTGAAASSAGRRAGEGISRILADYTPITRTGQKKLQPQLVKMISRSQARRAVVADMQDRPRNLDDDLRAQGVNGAIAAELAERVEALGAGPSQNETERVAMLAQLVAANGWTAPVRLQSRGQRRIITLIGPAGAGKTTAVAKLAATALMHGQDNVAVISLEQSRAPGVAVLERYARVLDFDFACASNPDRLRAALARFEACQLVVVDTPSPSPHDPDSLECLGGML
ncbi:MAG: hypothetical protein HKP58_08610, partial [Desulfatitalea sp.]|nr:hypothetical protein [Desulfatitalea sp.]NNK00461.1 hypothetical protein [Desulfatitalea sp.]